MSQSILAAMIEGSRLVACGRQAFVTVLEDGEFKAWCGSFFLACR